MNHLFKKDQVDALSEHVELELENGQTVFVSRTLITRFCEPGVLPELASETDRKE